MVGPLETGQGFNAQSLLEDAAAFDPGALTAFRLGAISGAEQSFGLGTRLREEFVENRAGFFIRSQGLTNEPLSKDAYESSEFFRPNVPWDEGMTQARAAALAELTDQQSLRDQLSRNHPISSFLGSIVGQAVDPINYIPVFGPLSKGIAIARGGRGVVAAKQGIAAGGGLGSSVALNNLLGGPIRGRAAAGAIDAAGNTLLAGALTAPARERLGDDTSFGNLMFEVGTAALIGAAFGGVVGVRDNVRARREMAAIRELETNRAALNESVGTLLEKDQVDISQAVADRISKLNEEATTRSFEDAIAELRAEVRLPKPEGRRPESLSDFLAEQGGVSAKTARGEITELTKLAGARKKVIRAKGLSLDEARERAAEAGFFDDIYGDSERAITESTDSDLVSLLRQDLEGDRVVRPADAEAEQAFKDFREQPNEAELDRALNELNEALANEDIIADGRNLPTETKARALDLILRGDLDAIDAIERATSEIPTPKVDTTVPPDPVPSARAVEVEARLGKPVEDLAADFGIDRTTGEFAELDDIAIMDTQGRLTAKEKAQLAEAEAIAAHTEDYNRAIEVARMCEA